MNKEIIIIKLNVEISKRPHGGYCVHILYKGECIAGEGYSTKSLPKMTDVRKYIKRKTSDFSL